MKKIYSLIKACMTNDMNIFKIRAKNNNKKNKFILPLFISLCFMFAIWSNTNLLFEKLSPMHLQHIVLSMVVFLTAIMTIIEGIYKTGTLIFNCKDDQLLLSLPIKKSTVLLVRIFKFYVFELIFNSLFIIPLIIAYIRWGENLQWTFFLTSFIMIFTLPIIPIIISCIIGAISSSLSSRFKYKNYAQVLLSMILLIVILYLSYNIDNAFDYLAKNATSINDLLIKLYYPAGLYAKLATQFNIIELLVYTLVNIILLIVSIFILSRFYFKINSKLKIVSNKKNNIYNKNKIKSTTPTKALIKKELNVFFNTPVFIINAGLGLVIFILASIIISFKFDSILPMLTNQEGLNISKEMIINNTSLLILILICFTAFMSSITNSVISLEGKNINTIKTLPITTKTILMSKIYSSLYITTPALLLGIIILFIRFKVSIIDCILLITLSILIPLISHFIGLIVNLKYPKLDAENDAEIVKQSTSSFVSVMIGMLLMIISIGFILSVAGTMSSTLILFLSIVIFSIIDILLYLYLVNKSIKDFDNLSI